MSHLRLHTLQHWSLKIPGIPGNLIKHPPPGFGLRVESGTHGSSLPPGEGGGWGSTHTHTHTPAHELCFLTDTGDVPVTTFPSITVRLVQLGQGKIRTVATPLLCTPGAGEPERPADGVWTPEKRQGGGLGSQAGPLAPKVVALSWVTDAERTGLPS